MTHFVTEKCIKCKYTDCVEVCPVDCFYEGANMLVINPNECIDCGVCVSECPVDAIVADSDLKEILNTADEALNDEQKKIKQFYFINTEYSKIWSSITIKKEPLENAECYKHQQNKDKYFKENL